jgi:hypothetical protein
MASVNFRAVTSSGTIGVTGRENGRAELSLNLSFADATGKTALVEGRVQAVTERFTIACT